MTSLGLVHVVHASYGLPPLQRFIESYHRHPAGIEHELILVFKAFKDSSLPENFRTLLAGVSHRAAFVPDGGFDLGSYFLAARNCEHQVLCFLNSSSVLLADDWLAKMSRALAEPGVGLVGATGSHESHLTNVLGRFRRPSGLNRVRYWARVLRRGYPLLGLSLVFRAFPNPHLRTNAFMIERQRWIALHAGLFRTKEDCHRFESGRRGLTARIRKQGLQVRVVDRNGRAWPPEHWPASRTFRSGGQENLLVADNRTRDYEQIDEPTRRLLSRFAWGESADLR